MAQPRGGTVTVLFTDLVGSTALADRIGPEATQALRRAHERILGQEFERYGGQVVKGTGDGFMVAFASARQGVECAVAVQLAIAAQHAEGRYLGLSVRAGLHTGEPVAEGGDLHGNDVSLAERIACQADGGQVLVSEVTRLLARQRRDVEFVPLGERMLKGFSVPVSIYEVRWPGAGAIRPRLTRFVGRQDEIARLRAALETAARGEGSLVLLAGEPGVGKTRLASELAIEAADRGFQVLAGRSYETEGMPPYLPFSEALDQLARDRTPEELQQELIGYAPYVAKLSPRLCELLPDVPAPVQLDPEAERYRLFEGVSDFFASVARRQPLLLFLDDLHWADDASLFLLQHLARRVNEAPLLVVGTYREIAVGQRHPLAALLTELTRRRLGERLTLRPLTRDESAALVEAALGRAPASNISDVLYEAAGGNAFFTEELVRHLRDQGHDLTDPRSIESNWTVPEGVRQVIGGRLARLSDEANRVLAYSSVLGRDLSLTKVAAVTEKDEDVLLDLLDEALAAGLLHDEGQGYAFAHPLIQEALYQELSRPRRGHLHRRVGDALEALYGDDVEPYLAELAHHFCEAAQAGGDTGKAFAYATRAGQRAMTIFAYEEAAGHFERALAAFDLQRPADDLQRCDLLLALGDARWRAGSVAAAHETFQRAAALARTLGDPDRLARAALGFGARGMVVGRVDRPLFDLLEEALEAVGPEDSALRAMLIARLADELYFTELQDRRSALTQEAVVVARRVGDPTALAAALRSRRLALYRPEEAAERAAATAEILLLAEQVNDRALALTGRYYRLIDLLELGEMAAADAEIDVVARLTEEVRQARSLWNIALVRTMRALLDGRFGDAADLAQQALEAGRRADEPDALLTYGGQMFLLRREQGRLDELEGTITAFVDQYPAVPTLRCALAYLHVELGHTEDAQIEFDRLAPEGFAGLPQDVYRVVGLTLLAEVCASMGAAGHAEALYGLLLPYARRNATMNYVLCTGSVARSLGLLAATMRRWDEATEHFDFALEMNAKMGARPWLAITQCDYARMLLARDGRADRARTVELLDQALAISGELGMRRVVEQASALRQQFEATGPPQPPGPVKI